MSSRNTRIGYLIAGAIGVLGGFSVDMIATGLNKKKKHSAIQPLTTCPLTHFEEGGLDVILNIDEQKSWSGRSFPIRGSYILDASIKSNRVTINLRTYEWTD